MTDATVTKAADTYRRADAGDSTSAAGPSCDARLCGRLFGGIVLAAFVLYGVGSGLADRPTGLILIGLNSVVVALAGAIGFRLLRSSDRGAGDIYLVARLAEATLLFGGVVLAAVADASESNLVAYQLGMIALGVGSVPFCLALRRGRWLPGWLALWGAVGYSALAVGALLELVSGDSVAVVFAVPGGLFELAVGFFLLRQGFGGGHVR